MNGLMSLIVVMYIRFMDTWTSRGCMGVMGFFFGHTMKPIYEEAKSAAPLVSFSADNATVDYNQALESLRNWKKTYAGRYCVRCGKD